MKKLLCTLLISLLVGLSACQDDPLFDTTNSKGEFFMRITEDNSINVIKIYESVPSGPAKISTSSYYDFPGNNFMRIGWISDGGKFYGAIYNLERVIWYDLDDFKNSDGTIDNILRIEFDQ